MAASRKINMAPQKTNQKHDPMPNTNFLPNMEMDRNTAKRALGWARTEIVATSIKPRKE
jgi:hypothetical protein